MAYLYLVDVSFPVFAEVIVKELLDIVGFNFPRSEKVIDAIYEETNKYPFNSRFDEADIFTYPKSFSTI